MIVNNNVNINNGNASSNEINNSSRSISDNRVLMPTPSPPAPSGSSGPSLTMGCWRAAKQRSPEKPEAGYYLRGVKSPKLRRESQRNFALNDVSAGRLSVGEVAASRERPPPQAGPPEPRPLASRGRG